jgi:hypothetical protein
MTSAPRAPARTGRSLTATETTQRTDIVRRVSRNTVLWTLVIFFGATIMFGYIRNATEDSSTATSLAAQLAAGLLLVAVIVLYVRRQR